MSKPLFSLEVFPPKRTAPIGTIYDTLDGLRGVDPAFISVTYGTGKQSDRTITARIANTIRTEYGIPAVAHLTAQYLDREQADEALDMFAQAKVTAVLALRGDRNPDREPAGVFMHASDLTRYIRQTQARAAGIDVPIEAGIMPVTNAASVRRMTGMCSSKVPERLATILDRWGDDPNTLKEAGIIYASEQIADLVARGVDGIHLYTMNHPGVTRRIWQNVRGLF